MTIRPNCNGIKMLYKCRAMLDNSRMEKVNPVSEAAQQVGGYSELGRKIGVTRQLVYHWKKRGFVSPAYVIAVERASGVPRHRLNPAVFGY